MSDGTIEKFEVEKAVGEFMAAIVGNAAESTVRGGSKFFKGVKRAIQLKMESSYRNYLTCSLERYSKSKSFLVRDESTPLYDYFVPMGVAARNYSSAAASIIDFTLKSNFSVLFGSGGTGKSMLMRHLFIDTTKKAVGIPVMVELRLLGELGGSLIDAIKIILAENKLGLDDEFIEKALEEGHFVIFLDGFEEIPVSRRRQVREEIQRLARRFEKNRIIVSSRPEDEVSRWSGFDTWEIVPLSKEQALELVRKIPRSYIDSRMRQRFVADLGKKLFDSHKSFLSNPLLLSIMSITYSNTGEVPHKITRFYENAFIGLFERHDVSKGAYKRPLRCDLDALEFKKIFSAFSFLSIHRQISAQHVGNSFGIPKTDALGFINTARKISDVRGKFASADFLHDAIKEVCLLVEEGPDINFAHSSFQEYFSAFFISELPDEDEQRKLIETFFMDATNMVRLLHEINPTVVEQKLLIPALERIALNIGYDKIFDDSIYLNFLKHSVSRLRLVGDERQERIDVALTPHKDYERLFAFQIYLFIVHHYSPTQKIGELSKSRATEVLGMPQKEARIYFDGIDANQLEDYPELLAVLSTDRGWGISKEDVERVFQLREDWKIKHERYRSDLVSILSSVYGRNR